MSEALLRVEGVSKHFDVRTGGFAGKRARLNAVDDVSFAIAPGETLGLVGESGCGKTTVGRMVLRLLAPSSGRVIFDGRDITALGESEMRPLRRDIQVVFQDPFSSLNPRMRVRDIVGEPLSNLGHDRRAIDSRVAELMDIVGLPKGAQSRYPHAFSGGQRQRIGIARALAARPRLIVCDEAVSALDVSVQAQILNLLADIQREFALTLLFISHNLGVVRHVSHRVAVMYLGRLVELADEGALFTRPLHPYSRALIDAVPPPDPRTARAQIVVPGEIPSPLDPPPGCAFHPRCPKASDLCRREAPAFRAAEAGRFVRCHHPG